MAIAFNAVTDPSGATATSLTFAHTCTGSNLVLLVTAAVYDGDKVTGATYNGVAMTLIVKQQNGGSDTNRWFYMFRLVAPATGTHDVVISRTGSADIVGSAVSYTGVDQTTPIDVFNSATEQATSSNISVTTTVANCWTVASHSSRNSNPTSITGTGRTSGMGDNDIQDSNSALSIGAHSLGWGWSVTDQHCMIIVALAPAVAATATSNFLQFFGPQPQV